MGVDYLKPAGRLAKVLSFIGCLAATAVCWFFVAVAVVGLRRSGTSVADQKTAWFIIVFFGLLGSATALTGYRLARGTVAQNQVTTMPILFIQAFGAFILVGMAFVGFTDGKWMTALEGSSLALAMIFIGRKIAKRRQSRLNEATEPTASNGNNSS
jgi:hypothetical protein